MNDLELEPLPDEVSAALSALQVPPLPPGVAEAVLAKVKVSAGLAAATVVATQVASHASSVTSTTASIATKAGASVLLKVLPVVTLATGIGLGVAADRVVFRPTAVEERVVIERVEVPAPVVVAPEPVKVAPKPVVAVKKPAVDTLGRERVLLDVARTALNSKDTVKALAAVDAHRSEFPSGQLVEEREALAVQVLLKAGRKDEAQTRFAQFRTRFPDSPLVTSLSALLR